MDYSLLIIIAAAFGAVSALFYLFAKFYLSRMELNRRLAGSAPSLPEDGSGSTSSTLTELVNNNFLEDRFGVDSTSRTKLQKTLLRAGYFRKDAIRFYIFSRISTVIIVPIVTEICTHIFLPDLPEIYDLTILVLSVGVGILGPDAYISRRQNAHMLEYRQYFPDMLDLLVVCVSSGLSIDAGFNRIKTQLVKKSPALAKNLELFSSEMRVGRSTVDALNALSDRLALDEAASLVTVLRHSIEMGGDIVETLVLFSDEMRERRLIRAEEAANELSVKMILPLALFIFPVIMMLVMLPVILKLLKVFAQ
jgi:tight adherence protein C